MGHCMIYEAAFANGIDSDLLAFYEVGVIKDNLDWFVECGGLSRARVAEMENNALDAILPRLDNLLDAVDIAPYCHAPIVSKARWEEFADKLPQYRGHAEFPLFEDRAEPVTGIPMAPERTAN